MSRRLGSGLVLALLASALHAYVPPTRTVREAMAVGRTAFLGRVVRLEEVSIGEHEAVMKMRVIATGCFYGNCCDTRPLTMTYVSESFADRELPVDFHVGREVLFVLSSPISCGGKPRRFDSRFGPTMDFAWLGASLPQYRSDAGTTTLTSVYWSNVQETVAYADLAQWGRERSAQIRSDLR